MHVCVVCCGSRGDVEPIIVLGMSLLERLLTDATAAATVTVVTHGAHASLFTDIRCRFVDACSRYSEFVPLSSLPASIWGK